ncbi:MAG: hypothetical protein PHV62_03155 [Sulfuricurvum sp.]|nr:hypothetical protein [Sulfuricurvum sp.]
MKTLAKVLLYFLVGIISLVLGSFLANECFADSIKCYSHGKLVYSHHVSHVTYTGDVIAFIEDSTGNAVFYNGECVAKIERD